MDIKENGSGKGEENEEQGKQALRERLITGYGEYMKELHKKTPEELIGKAEEIAAVKLIYEELVIEKMYEEYAGYLQQFANPLEAVKDHWLYHQNCDSSEQLDYVLWNMEDKGISASDYPSAGQPAEETGQQGVVMC